ncbi:hypothetical protein B0A48_12513 [Cryoendolithus antarcticus]|uniref:Uncharacterized protein n=1 Tax=Cryoendolithus antarcticus TaxID=1507870 RepID=A0A1V8SSJ1_9PEZI|nr:hypothetical protein B0A48_12513 [Cryoendolithus antarcticus]
MKLPFTFPIRWLFCCHVNVEPPNSTEPLAAEQHDDEVIELQNIVYQTRFTRRHPIYAAQAEKVATEWARSKNSLGKGRVVDEHPPQIPPMMPLLGGGLTSGSERTSTEAVVGEDRAMLETPNYAMNRKKSTQGNPSGA